MDARELLAKQFDDAGFQLNMALEGLSEKAMDAKTPATAMSPRETLAHLCECYVAVLAIAKGDKHEWGSYQPDNLETEPLRSTCSTLRTKACQAVAELPDDRLIVGNEYILAHDYYHVGQLCLARVASEPDWDAYSIYKH